jgi:16S rRNA G966 N2-methylase RsmD
MLNLDIHIKQMLLFFRFGIPCGAEILQHYSAYAIEDNYFDRGKRHFISADFSWYRLFEIYKELFGRENILVFPQEMTLKEPKLVLKLLSSFIGEKITPKEMFLSKRDNSTYRINTPFATKEHEELFKNYIMGLNTLSNRKLNNALPYINLDEYGYFENVNVSHVKIFVGVKTSKRLTLNNKLCKVANYTRNCFRRRGTSATILLLLSKAKVLTRIKCKLILQSVHNKLMLLLDKLYGVDFEQMLPIEDLGTKKKESEQYECTKIIEVKKIFDKIDLPSNSIAVDFGSGKGKMLCFLAKYKNIKRVYGIEISEYLVNIAIRNIAKLGIHNVQILNMNALDIPNDIIDKSNLFYFYNPFPKQVFVDVFQKIELSLKRRTRDVYIVYFNPINADVIDNSSMFQKQATYSNIISFAKATIYRSH